MAAVEKPLRILVVVNLPWDSRLGAARVWMELAEQWRAMGHTVEKFSLSDVFRDTRASRVKFALRQLLFPYYAAAFVKRNAARFDVIDALIGTLPFSKRDLHFAGLVVARSVGLYRLYERFEQSQRERWPQHPRGKIAGRVLYRFTNRRATRASDRAVQHADLINVPNEEEAECLRADFGERLRIVVQPYGLTAERRASFREAAATADSRLQQKRVCFIGMWGARKGSYDWRRIIERVRQDVPDARFRFLGTMIEAGAVHADLGTGDAPDVELVSDYQPDDLPKLLSDCTVGAFPSYVEGFGLAVLEQLAAGLPTVAYDTAGPRDMLQATMPEMLVAKGDPEAMGAAISRLLRSDGSAYGDISERSLHIAEELSWPEIARATISTYRAALTKDVGPIAFVQPFSVGSAGGGARILRALLEQSPMQWRSICSSPDRPKTWRDEIHIPRRPSWGKIERSRFGALPQKTAKFFARRFRRRLRDWCEEHQARAIHAVPHSGLDFADAHAVARQLSLPFFVSLHDDLAYTTAAGAVPTEKREAAMQRAWNEAEARFVISDSLGAEYSRRYGAREYQIVTDGLTAINQPRPCCDPEVLHIYFMGMFHMPYEHNLRALLDGLAIFEREERGIRVRVSMRCEHVRPQVIAGEIPVTVLPFSDEAQVQRDIETADLLYMPLPFGAEHENFARYSLSTKMVTYIGSGVPILYHGPSSSAAFELLSRHRAAVLAPTLEPIEIAHTLQNLDTSVRRQIAENALALAHSSFMLADQTQRFWGTITRSLAPA